MKRTIWLAGAAALAALTAAATATPAAAQGRVGFSVSVGNGYGSYYGAPYRASRYYGYESPRRYRYAEACAFDPYCDPFAQSRYAQSRYARGRYAAPPYPASPYPYGVREYETRDYYDPLPRWREVAGRPDRRDDEIRVYDAPPRAAQDDYQRYDNDLYGQYEQGTTIPQTRGDLVRYDLILDDRQTRRDDGAQYVAGYSDPYQPTYEDRYSDPYADPYADPYGRSDGAPVRFDRYEAQGSAQSYIRQPYEQPRSADPDDVLLGGR